MVCMGARQTVDEPNPDRRPNAEFYLKSPRQMAELFADQPGAIVNAARIADRCEWELDLESFHFPAFDMKRLRAEPCRKSHGGAAASVASGEARQRLRFHPGPHTTGNRPGRGCANDQRRAGVEPPASRDPRFARAAPPGRPNGSSRPHPEMCVMHSRSGRGGKNTTVQRSGDTHSVGQ